MASKERKRIIDVYNKKVQDICPCLTEPHHNSIRVIEDFYQERKPREYEDVAPTLRSDRIGLKIMMPKIDGMLQVIVKKRSHQTPKEINQYLKSMKKELTISMIAEELYLPKTQVEHYFRTDKCRAIPSPETWNKLKMILKLDNRFDKEVTEFYEKEMEYEMTRRVYDPDHPMPTLKNGNVLVTQRSTSTPSRSTKRTSGSTTTTGTHGKSGTANSPISTSWLRDFLAKHSALQVSGKGSPTPEELSFLRSLGFSETKDPDIYCLRTSRVYYLMTREKLSRGSLGFLPTWGMTFNGRCLTARTSEFHRTGNACSLSEVLETDPDQKYFLSEKSMEFLNKRMTKDKDHPT